MTNTGTVSLTITFRSRTTPARRRSPADDFIPKYVSGDANNNGLLDPGETWLYTSSGVVSYQVQAGLYGNTSTVIATPTTGISPSPPPTPTTTSGPDTVPRRPEGHQRRRPAAPDGRRGRQRPEQRPRKLAVGTNVVWTYLLTNTGTVPSTITSFKDDAGTPGITGDDFEPKYVSGDANSNHLVDPGETWLYTSSTVVTYHVRGRTVRELRHRDGHRHERQDRHDDRGRIITSAPRRRSSS